jgi:hypothetical protein
MSVYKRQRKPKGQSRKDNPDTLVTLGTKDEGKKKTNKKKTTTKQQQQKNNKKQQYRKVKRFATPIPIKIGGEPKWSRRVSSSCLL